ncbi:MAG: hypothetical protein DRP71_10850 [Verrucomicrobia bacterium]|nr:MAG: hypothetical protein DRP71_10850 [Verrucomicrobiota bacterium]
MTPRERFHATMNFEPVDRLPLVEWAGWWTETLDRWYGEGLPTDLTDRYDIVGHFGLEKYKQTWFRSVHRDVPPPEVHGAGLLTGEGTFEDKYEKLHPSLFQIHDTWPIDPAVWSQWAAEQEKGDSVLWFTVEGPFWFPRTLFGIEDHFYAYYDEPDLMHRMNRENTEWTLRIIDRLCEICTPDFMTFAEDMSYNNGPMLSEDLFNEFMLPYYERIVPVLKERGIIPVVDSDGDITKAIPWFERAGIDAILPLERQAGVDLQAIREAHPRFRCIGHFDKLVMHRGEEAIRGEFERLLPIARQGGFIISCDHQTPPGVSLEDYRLYLRLFAEYAEQVGS